MRSSTSNSEPSSATGGTRLLAPEGRLVSGGWGATFLVAALVALGVLGGWEMSWRSRGVAGSVSDLQASWSVAREGARGDAVVLAGTSKMQSAIDPRVLGESLGREGAVQLALIDRSPLPVLEELARDERFAGTVVVDVAPRIFFDGDGGREAAAEEILRGHEAYLVSPGERIDARLGLLVESSLALRRPAFSLRQLVEWPLTSRALRMPFSRVRLDRFRELDFDRLDVDRRRASQARIVATVGRPAAPDEVVVLARRVAAATEAIQGRGGAVFLTLLPISGRARQEEERRFPRAAYWDQLLRISGLPGIHFADHPQLADFECTDGLHLERQASTAFTLAFAGVLAHELH